MLHACNGAWTVDYYFPITNFLKDPDLPEEYVGFWTLVAHMYEGKKILVVGVLEEILYFSTTNGSLRNLLDSKK